MLNSLLDQSRSAFPSSVVNELACLLHEESAAVQKALNGLLPTLLNGVINRAQSHEGATLLYHLLATLPAGPALTAARLTDGHCLQATNAGNELLEKLFGYRAEWVIGPTATYCQITYDSAITLGGLVMLVIMSLLGKQAQTKQFTQAELAAALQADATTTRMAVQVALAGENGWYKHN